MAKTLAEPVDIFDNIPIRVYMIPDYSPTESKIVFNDVNHIAADGV